MIFYIILPSLSLNKSEIFFDFGKMESFLGNPVVAYSSALCDPPEHLISKVNIMNSILILLVRVGTETLMKISTKLMIDR